MSRKVASPRKKSYLLDPYLSLSIPPVLWVVMDWFSWLSKTSLDLTLVYDYGVVFACNELTAEDIPHFDHEFLQSMGIIAAKHRLEIIKLARSEARSRRGSVSGRVLEAFNRTKRRVVNCAKMVLTLHQKNPKMVVKYQRRGEQRKEHGKGEVFMLTHHSHDEQLGSKSLGFRSPRPMMMRSGPLERSNAQTTVISTNSRGHSGPLKPSSWLHEKSDGHRVKKSPVVPLTPSMCRSPRRLECNDGIDSLWAKLFQDMKPT